MNDPSTTPTDPPTAEPDSNPDAGAVVVTYPVRLGDDPDPELPAQLAGLELPRRPWAGARGVLLVDRDAHLVVILDADDQAATFTPRAVRAIAGDVFDLDYPPDGSDHIIRAAYEPQYDVIAAPWAGGAR